MASLPSQTSWRRSSPSEQSLSEPIETPSDSSSCQPESSSQSFILNNPNMAQLPDSSNVEKAPAPEPPASQPPTQEIRTCWICQQDSGDDTPGQQWRRPCPCSLTAHDECLLEWISSEEAPRPGDIATARQIKCPQCQAPIKIERPRDYLVLTTGKIQFIAKSLVAPTAVSAFLGCFYSGFLVYGVNTLHVVFGAEEAARIMAPSPYDMGILNAFKMRAGSHAVRKIFKIMDPFLPSVDSLPNWKLFVGLPLIAPSLVLLRTTVADKLFTVLPITVRIVQCSLCSSS
jgi:hypothetical protein